MRSLAIFFLCALAPVLRGSSDLMSAISEVEFRSLNRERLVIQLWNAAVTEIAFEDSGKRIPIPKNALEGIVKPQLDTVAILSGRYSNADGKRGAEYKFVRFSFGDAASKRFGLYPEVEFHFIDGVYVERRTKRMLSEHSWTHDVMKADEKTPNQALEPTATSVTSPAAQEPRQP
jgi:hypothetical protein